MASEDYIPLSGGGEQYEVIDEVTNTEFKGKDDATKKGEIILQGSEVYGTSETHREIRSSLEKEGLSAHDIYEESSKQAQSTSEEASTVHTKDADITKAPPPEQVVGVENSSEVNRSVSKLSDNLKITGSVNAEKMDTVYIKFVQSVTRTVPEESKMLDEKTISIEANQNNESENKMEVIKPKSSKGILLAPCADVQHKQAIVSNLNVLLVGGLYPGQSGDLKQLLNTTLGARSHVIEPRQKGDAVLRLRFKSKDEMEIAKTLLHNQLFLGSKLSAVVQNNQKQKRKAEEGDETNKPPAKKLKQEPFAQKSSKVTYKAQIAEKTADVHAKLHLLANILGGNYPKYNGLITQRQLKYGGLICPLNRFSACSPNKRFENWCKFSVGTEEATGLFAVGLRADSGYVNKISSVKHNFPPHVVKVAKVFEKMVRVSEKASEDSVGRCQHQFWHELVIRTNEACELMLIVYVHGSEELALGRMERLNKELKEFFENGERNNYGVTSIYTKVTYTTARIPPQLNLVVGSPYFEETVMDLKFHLQPTVHFWSNIDAARMVCTGVKQLLTPTKNNTLLEVSFSGLGLVGLYLSRDVGEVLSVDAQRTVEEARKTATLNNITNCKYFDGSPEVVLHKVAENIKYDKACAVVICGGNNISACVKAMEELRKIEKVRRLVLVTEVFKSRFNFIMTLCNPTRRKGRGNPFFPMRAIPVDTVPKAKGYVLMILMQRIGLLSLHQTVNQTVNDPAMQSTGKGPGNCRAAGIVMPYDKEARKRRMRQGDARLKIILRREERELLQQRNEKYSFRVPEGHMFEGRMSGESHFYKQYPRTGQFDRPYSHAQSSVLEEGQLKDLKAKEWKRMMEKEEQQHWLEREEQRRWLEKEEHGKWIQDKEEHARWMEEKELKRQIEEKKLKRWMEEERERELMRTGVNLKTTNSVVQDLIADSLRETNISQLSVETAQKLKQLIAEAVRSVGVIDQEERQSIFSTSRGIGGIHPRAVMSSQLRRSDKEMLEGDTHYVREVDYVHQHKHMEVDNVHQHKHNACGSAVGRHEDKQMPHSRHFEKVYSPSTMEISSLYQRRYEGESSGGSNNNLPHVEGEDSYTRHIYHSDVNTSQMQEEKFSQNLNNYVSYEHLAGSYVRNARQASQNIRPSFNSGMEKTAGSNVRHHALNWNTVNAETNYIPLSDPRKEIACSIPKPPGTDDAYFPGRSNYVYRDSVPGTSFRWQEDSTHTWY